VPLLKGSLLTIHDRLSEMVGFDFLSTDIQPLDVPLLSGKRVLVAEAWNATPHLETGLEIAIRLARSGCVVDYLHYGHCLPAVEYYVSSHLYPDLIPDQALFPQELGQLLLQSIAADLRLPLEILSVPDLYLNSSHEIPAEYLQSLENLIGYDGGLSPLLGLSVAGSLVTAVKSSLIKPIHFRSVCNKLALSFVCANQIVSAVLKQRPYEALVVFNGRFPCVKGAVLAAQSHAVSVWFHERGSSQSRFVLQQYQTHDRLNVQRHILKMWQDQGCKHEAESAAHDFFIKARSGDDLAWTSFAKNQQNGLAYTCVQRAKSVSKTGRVVVYFSSSDDEFVGARDAYVRDSYAWTSQSEALQVLAQEVDQAGHSLVIRVHPHLSKKHAIDRAYWNHLQWFDEELRSRVVLVPSSSKMSSYELIDLADLVVCYGSTVGIEAAYWQRPVLLLGNSFYDRLGAAVVPATTAESVAEALSMLESLPIDRSSCLPYGFYAFCHGFEYDLYKPKSLFEGSFMNVQLQPKPSLLTRLRRRLAPLLSFDLLS